MHFPLLSTLCPLSSILRRSGTVDALLITSEIYCFSQEREHLGMWTLTLVCFCREQVPLYRFTPWVLEMMIMRNGPTFLDNFLCSFLEACKLLLNYFPFRIIHTSMAVGLENHRDLLLPMDPLFLVKCRKAAFMSLL